MKLRFGLIGCGRIAARHAEYMAYFGSLIAVCDILKVKVDGFSSKYGAKSYYSLDEFLSAEDKPDLVAVCTPNGLHAEQSIRILEAGMHVLCEKPMAISSLDCLKMIAASEVAGKCLFVVMQNRFNPPVVALKKILEERRLGKIYSVQLNCFWNRTADYYTNTWRGTLHLDGGTLYTQFSHFIDLLYWMIGDVKNSKAYLSNDAHNGIIEFEDTGVVILEFENGVRGSIHYTVNSFNNNMEGSITIFGEKGTIKIGGQYLNRIEYQNIENYKINNLPPGNGVNEYGNYQGSMSNHDKVYQNLVDFFEHRKPVYINANDSMKTVEIIELIYKNAKI